MVTVELSQYVLAGVINEKIQTYQRRIGTSKDSIREKEKKARFILKNQLDNT